MTSGLALAGCGHTRHPAPGSGSGLSRQELEQRLAASVPGLLQQHSVPALGFARYRSERVDVAVAFGEQSAGVPATARTLFNPASLTKPVSAEVFLRAATSRGLDLDAPVGAIWTDPDLLGDPRAQRLTARMLLSHRSGFANWRSQTGGKLRFDTEPGTAFGYSGEGYEYLAKYLATLTGSDLEALARRYIFRPAGMADTSYIRQPWFEGRQAIPWQNGWLEPAVQTSAIASDDLWTTPHDYALFMGSVMKGEGITPELARQRLTVQTDRRAAMCDFAEREVCPSGVGMGLGWEVQTYPHTTVLMHTGNDAGTFAFAAIDMARQEAVVAMTNGAGGGAVAVALVDRLGLDPAFTGFLNKLAGG